MIAELLYYIFIFPLEQVLDWAFFTLFKANNHYGVSIIFERSCGEN